MERDVVVLDRNVVTVYGRPPFSMTMEKGVGDEAPMRRTENGPRRIGSPRTTLRIGEGCHAAGVTG